MAERTGIEPVGTFRNLRFSKPLHYQPAHAPYLVFFEASSNRR